MRDVDYRILGSLEALSDGQRLPLGGLKQRALLAVLLLNAHKTVTTDALVEALWSGKPPRRPHAAVQRHVFALRRALDPEDPFSAIVTEPAGYRLRLEPVQLDLRRFEALLETGRDALSAGDPLAAQAALSQALALFRAAPLADFAHQDWARPEITRLEELRLGCQEWWIDAEIALGRHAECVGVLEELIAENPLRERLRAQLMLALYRSGRRSDALAVYEDARRALADQFGIETSRALHELASAISRKDQGLVIEPAATPWLTPTLARFQTFLFTDVEGSTRLLRRLGNAYGAVLVEHRRLLREVVEARGGRVVDSYGDGVFAAFPDAVDAVEAAASAQRALAGYPWPERTIVRVRMGLHTGRPIALGSGFFGIDVHRVARICSASHGGQVLVSEETARALVGAALDGLELRSLGRYALRDIAEPESLYQLVGSGLADEFPPPRVDSRPPDVPRADRSILVLDEGDAFAVAMGVAETLAGSSVPHELIVARLIYARAAPPDELEARLASAAVELFALQAGLTERGVSARVAAFTTWNAGEDTARLAAEQAVDLVLLGRTPAQLVDGTLDTELEDVLAHAPCHVGLCVGDRGGRSSAARDVVVPFGGAEHDWAALELGAWIASANGAAMRLLGTAGQPRTGKRDASRLLASASLAVQQLVRVPTEPELLAPGPGPILQAAADGSFLVVGVPDEWRAIGLGETRRRLVRSNGTTVFVKRGLRPGGLAPRGSQTRFTWSIADVAVPYRGDLSARGA